MAREALGRRLAPCTAPPEMSGAAARARVLPSSIPVLPSILVVANDSYLRDEIGAVVVACEQVAVPCADGLSAIERVRMMLIPPALILLDWIPYGTSMMSGHEFLARQASNPRYGITPIVVVASPGIQDIPRLCVSGVLRKPISAMALIETIAKHAARAKIA